jgi:hypothetical protein
VSRLDIMQGLPRPQPFAVVINNSKPQAHKNGANEGIRPLTVDEALQYTPFTTSVATNHGKSPRILEIKGI